MKAFKFLQSVAFDKNAPVMPKEGEEPQPFKMPEHIRFSVSHDGKPVIHQVDEEIQALPEFQKYLDAGYIVEASDEGAAYPKETLVQRGHRIASKLMAEDNAKPPEEFVVEDEAQVSPEMETQALQADEDFSQEVEAPKPKRKK